VDDVLRGVFTRGTAKSAASLGFDAPAAGKTGTTDGTRDAWFVGYTEEHLALVWVGYDDNAMTGLTGATGALPIWADLMSWAEVDRSAAPAQPPDGLVVLDVCQETGQLAVRKCPTVVESGFVAGTEPTTRCAEHEGKLKRWWRKLLSKN
jgi:penicillin-binding protein 1B